MKLRDLDARFLNRVTATGCHTMRADTIVGAQGVMFQCPSCAAGREIKVDRRRPGRRHVVGAHYIQVLFSNPRGADAAAADLGIVGSDGKTHPRWELVSGDSLDDLTLAPSINCDIPSKDGTPSICKFHGYVKNGDAA